MRKLRERMSNVMCLRGTAFQTQEVYLDAVTERVMFYRRSPTERGASRRPRPTCDARSATGSLPARASIKPRASSASSIGGSSVVRNSGAASQILSREEAARRIGAARTLRVRTLLMTTDAAGLRVPEVCALPEENIESAASRLCLNAPWQERQDPMPAVVALACTLTGVTPGRNSGCFRTGRAWVWVRARSRGRNESITQHGLLCSAAM